MAKHQNTIELNGKTYDVSTGKMLDHAAASPKSTPPHTQKSAAKPKVVDGFFQPKRSSQQSAKVVAAPKPHSPQTVSKPRAATARSAATPVKHRKPASSRTLMREAVSRPALPQAGTSPSPKVHERTADHVRLKRAQAVSMSNAISRFGVPEPTSTKTLAPLAVTPEPAQKPYSIPDHAPKLHKAPASSLSAAEQHFNRALANAHAHEEPKEKPAHRRKKLAHKLGLGNRAMRAASVSLAVILLIGFFAYQNIPNISMRIAANRAGFNADLPSYTPAGFGMNGPVKYGPGYLAVNFASKNDDRNFTVSQRVSSWNSEALVDNFLNQENKQYQTFENKGRTIYVYDGGNATWVNGGVWYQIEGNNSLKNDQLMAIAGSM